MMLTPLFDRHSELVGWLDPGKHIFNAHMAWVAFLANEHVWSASTGEWIGPINGGLCYDGSGKLVAWSHGEQPAGLSVRPTRPARPARPIRPSQPMRPSQPLRPACPFSPMGRWSGLSFGEWARS